MGFSIRLYYLTIMKTTHLPLAIVLFMSVAAGAQEAAAVYNEGKSLREQGRKTEAIEHFKKAVSMDPGYVEARYELAWTQNDIKDYSNALVNLRQVRNAWPGTVKVYFELGYAFEKLALYDSAMAAYKMCIQIKPDYASAYRQLGYVHYQKKEEGLALDNFKKFEEYTKTPSKDYIYWYRKGFSCNAVKDYNAALIALQQSVDIKQDYLNTWLERGFALSRLKRDDEAIADYKKAIGIDPKSHIAYNGIGEVYRDNKKDNDQAIYWYQKALEVTPKERKACFGIGYCLNSQGKFSEAIPYLQQAIESEATYTAAYTELGYSFYKTSRLDDAVTQFRKAISLSPANENARYYLALLYIDQKDKAKATQVLDELKKLSSKHAASIQAKVDGME